MSKKANEELMFLQELLSIEKAEDLAQYQQKLTSSSFKERRELGVLWYPIRFENIKYDAGERLIVEFSRAPEHQQRHSFQNGKAVQVFSNESSEDESLNGVVNKVDDQKIVVTLNCDEAPNWLSHQKIGLQLLFDDNSYREMEYSLSALIKSENPRVNELKNKLLGLTDSEFVTEKKVFSDELNVSQNEALNQIISARDFAVLHGPPGTGKTTTLVQSIIETLKSESQVMVCAPSNAALDLLVEKLDLYQVSTVRIGHPARVTEQILDRTIDAQVARHSDFKLMRDLRKQSEEYFAMSGKWKRSFGAAEREQRKMLLTEARKLRTESQKLKNYIINNVLIKSQVVACTLIGVNHKALKGMEFDTVFIDEAGQALEPACWIPVLKSNRIIFAGDHLQLPPTVKSQEAGRKGLTETLFEKVIARSSCAVMLKEQYRMNEKIMQFSSDYFYHGELFANKEVKDHLLFKSDCPVEFVDTAGTGFFEGINTETRSTYNQEEAQLLVKHLKLYLKHSEEEHGCCKIKVAVISPYKAQVEVIEGLLKEDHYFSDKQKQVKVNTIDSFQGQERDVVYLSLVRSNENNEIGFLKDERRMNVAMTRAKKKLVIIGDSSTIGGKNKFYNSFLDYAQEINAYKSAFEIIYSD